VAELAMGEIILLCGGRLRRSTLLHGGVWNKSRAGAPRSARLDVGLWGYGKIRVAGVGLAEAMGMRVVFHERGALLRGGNARPLAFANCWKLPM